MTGRTLISVSFCAEHWKGAYGVNRQPGEMHWLWLEECIDYLRATYELPLIVAATAYPGILEVNNSADDCSRDVAWRVIAKGTPIMGTPNNPGHQVGAALCVRLGLEYAAKCGYDYLIHTAEDVIPRLDAISRMIAALDEGYAYVGEAWSSGPSHLNAQFFACRVGALVGPWDACRTFEHGHIEGYLGHLLDAKTIHYLGQGTYYHTTHDFAEWRRLIAEKVAERQNGGAHGPRS